MTNKELEKMVKEQNEKVDKLAEMMELVIKSMPAQKTEEPKKVDLPPEVGKGLPFPARWRQKINEILGEQFDAEVGESSGGDYLIRIYMPSQFDRRAGGENKFGRDVSVGLVRRATDLADVEKWCKLINGTLEKMFPNYKKL